MMFSLFVEFFFIVFNSTYFSFLEIAMDYRTVVCPIIDFIDHRTFLYRAGHTWTRGTFSWRFDYKERSITADQYLHRKDEADPVP